jgi:hypothetical protein
MGWRLAIAALAVLSGCGESAYIQYQGRDAMTALECQAGYEAAKDRASGTVVAVPNTGAGIAAIVLAAGVLNGSREAAYERCLSRVATLPPGSATGLTTPASQSFGSSPPATRPVGCASGSGPFQGGTGYCVGR